MDLDIELFISEIQSRPAIWNTNCESYSNRGEKLKAWEEICESFVGNFSNKTAKEKNVKLAKLQRKWKSLRDSFSRENAKSKKVASGSTAPSSKQYIYYNQLSFLNSLKEDKLPTDDVPENDNSSSSSNRMNVEMNKGETPRLQINKQITKATADKPENEILKHLSETIKRKYEAIEIDNDPDRQFLMSLLPHVKRIDENSKLDFQSDVLQLIRKYTQRQNYEIFSARYDGCSSENVNAYSLQNSVQPTSIIQPSPTHSYCSDQSVDINSVVEVKFRVDNE